MVNYLFCMIKSNLLGRFIRSEEGAVTVDFVVLTGVVVLIGAAAASGLTTTVNTAVSGIDLSAGS